MVNVSNNKPPPVIVVQSGGKGWTRSQCLRALRRRRDWLEARAGIRNDAGKPNFLDEQELAGLKWALNILENTS
jgi:hypothetical protein